MDPWIPHVWGPHSLPTWKKFMTFMQAMSAYIPYPWTPKRMEKWRFYTLQNMRYNLQHPKMKVVGSHGTWSIMDPDPTLGCLVVSSWDFLVWTLQKSNGNMTLKHHFLGGWYQFDGAFPPGIYHIHIYIYQLLLLISATIKRMEPMY